MSCLCATFDSRSLSGKMEESTRFSYDSSELRISDKPIILNECSSAAEKSVFQKQSFKFIHFSRCFLFLCSIGLYVSFDSPEFVRSFLSAFPFENGMSWFFNPKL